MGDLVVDLLAEMESNISFHTHLKLRTVVLLLLENEPHVSTEGVRKPTCFHSRPRGTKQSLALERAFRGG